MPDLFCECSIGRKKDMQFLYDSENPFDARIANAEMYRKGIILAEWISFPFRTEDFRTVLGKIGIDENEKDADKWCLIDYDSFVPGLCRHFGEHESVEVLNTLAGILCTLSDYDGMKFAAVSETDSFASAPEEYILLCAELAEFTFYPHICSTYDLGYCFILESGINDLQYFLRYMDFAGYGKDILQAGQGLFTGQGCLIRNLMHHKI